MEQVKKNWLIIVAAAIAGYFIFGGGAASNTGVFDGLLHWATGGDEFTYMVLEHCFGGDKTWLNYFIGGLTVVCVSYVFISWQLTSEGYVFYKLLKRIKDMPEDEQRAEIAAGSEGANLTYSEMWKSFISILRFAIIFLGCGIVGYAFLLIELQIPIKRVHTVLLWAHALHSLEFAIRNNGRSVAKTWVAGLRR